MYPQRGVQLVAWLCAIRASGATALPVDATTTAASSASGLDIALLSLACFLGNVGVALTGFGMAIVYIFVWQIAVLSGYESNLKYAIFIQALALFSAQVNKLLATGPGAALLTVLFFSRCL
jgi:hypothetical protein